MRLNPLRSTSMTAAIALIVLIGAACPETPYPGPDIEFDPPCNPLTNSESSTREILVTLHHDLESRVEFPKG